MWFSKALIIVATATLSLASVIPSTDLLRRGSDSAQTGGVCTSGDFVGPTVVGSAQGTTFCESAWTTTFVPIVTIEVWWVPEWVVGIRMTYADGTVSPVYGKTADYGGAAISVNYALGDRFSKVFIYGGPNYNYVRHLIIRASNGQIIRAGVGIQYGDDGYGLPYTEQSTGDGVLIAITGAYTNPYGMNNLGLAFLASPVTSIKVTDLSFPNGPTGGQNLHPETLAQGHFYNSQDTGNSTWTFADSRALTTTYTFTQTSANTYGGSETFTVSASIPMIITVSSATAFMWSYTYTEANAVTTTKTVTITWTESGSLLPHTGVACAALISTGSGTFPYTSTVTMNLASGSQYTYQEAGSLTLSDVSDALVTVEDDNNPPSTPPSQKASSNN